MLKMSPVIIREGLILGLTRPNFRYIRKNIYEFKIMYLLVETKYECDLERCEFCNKFKKLLDEELNIYRV